MHLAEAGWDPETVKQITRTRSQIATLSQLRSMSTETTTTPLRNQTVAPLRRQAVAVVPKAQRHAQNKLQNETVDAQAVQSPTERTSWSKTAPAPSPHPRPPPKQTNKTHQHVVLQTPPSPIQRYFSEAAPNAMHNTSARCRNTTLPN